MEYNANGYYVNPQAVVDEGAKIGKGTRIWFFSHICGGAVVGEGCNLGQNVFVGDGAVVGNHCKLQNDVNVFDGVTLEDYVFCGPGMTFTNVRTPRCKFPKTPEEYTATRVKEGASLGAGVVVVCGVTIGENALVGSGAVVTKDVPAHALMVGVPARRVGWACACGGILDERLRCPKCGNAYREGKNGLHKAEEEK